MRVYRCRTCGDVVFVASTGPTTHADELERQWQEHRLEHGQIEQLVPEEWPDLSLADGEHTGLPGAELSEKDLMRELARLHFTRHDTFLHGSTKALVTHSERQRELEDEYLRRHPARDIDPERLRSGARKRTTG